MWQGPAPGQSMLAAESAQPKTWLSTNDVRATLKTEAALATWCPAQVTFLPAVSAPVGQLSFTSGVTAVCPLFPKALGIWVAQEAGLAPAMYWHSAN